MAKILVIDDDAAIVDLLRMRLEAEGHTVFAAMDASAGMMLAARDKPDLITLDFQMPAGDGAKVYERVRANIATKIPIIFVTGMSQQDLEQSLQSDPTVRFLQKPIDMAQLKRFIAELLGAPPKAGASPAGPSQPKPQDLDGGAFGGDVLDLDA